MTHTLLALCVIFVVLVPAFALGLWAIRHQRKFNESLRPNGFRLWDLLDPDAGLVTDARRRADAYVFNPALVVDVPEDVLRERPANWNGETIRVIATWSHRFEGSFIGPAFVRLMNDSETIEWGEFRVQAIGLWVFPRAPQSTKNMPGFGHLGMSWGEFRIYRLTFLSSE